MFARGGRYLMWIRICSESAAFHDAFMFSGSVNQDRLSHLQLLGLRVAAMTTKKA